MWLIGILIPFIGTSLGAGCVLFIKNSINEKIEKQLLGFASGVMVAASVWSLLIPAISQSEYLGKFSFLPAVIGFVFGIVLLPAVDRLTPHLNLSKTKLMVLAVTVHNIPEGMAVGVAVAAAMMKNSGVTVADALALSIGVAIQNFPEGAIVSLPIKTQGKSKRGAFFFGVLSGAVEPIAAFVTLLAFNFISPALPYFLSFAAGAMIYVVVEELIPEAALGKNNIATFSFAVGFCTMMSLDIVFG